jgi:hypothetical protein
MSNRRESYTKNVTFMPSDVQNSIGTFLNPMDFERYKGTSKKVKEGVSDRLFYENMTSSIYGTISIKDLYILLDAMEYYQGIPCRDANNTLLIFQVLKKTNNDVSMVIQLWRQEPLSSCNLERFVSYVSGSMLMCEAIKNYKIRMQLIKNMYVTLVTFHDTIFKDLKHKRNDARIKLINALLDTFGTKHFGIVSNPNIKQRIKDEWDALKGKVDILAPLYSRI